MHAESKTFRASAHCREQGLPEVLQSAHSTTVNSRESLLHLMYVLGPTRMHSGSEAACSVEKTEHFVLSVGAGVQCGALALLGRAPCRASSCRLDLY